MKSPTLPKEFAPVAAAIWVMLFVPGGVPQMTAYCVIGFGWAAWLAFSRTNNLAWVLLIGMVGTGLVYAVYRSAHWLAS
jgi:hypothetical protein